MRCMRDHRHGGGCESIALIPLRYGGRTFGLIQFYDSMRAASRRRPSSCWSEPRGILPSLCNNAWLRRLCAPARSATAHLRQYGRCDLAAGPRFRARELRQPIHRAPARLFRGGGHRQGHAGALTPESYEHAMRRMAEVAGGVRRRRRIHAHARPTSWMKSARTARWCEWKWSRRS